MPPNDDDRDQREVTLNDEQALELMQGWTGGVTDPLYAISSTGGWNYAWVFEYAIDNLDADISRVNQIGPDEFQLGKGVFTKEEIDELHYIRDALSMALYEDTGKMRESRSLEMPRGPRRRPSREDRYPAPPRPEPGPFVTPRSRGRRRPAPPPPAKTSDRRRKPPRRRR